VLAAVAVTAPVTAASAGQPGLVDPRTPRCEAASADPQVVVVGELTALSTRCVSPSGAALAVTALTGSVTPVFGTLFYRADDVGPGYDKLTVQLAGVGPGGPAATVIVRLVER
jgi:hypothetical protein